MTEAMGTAVATVTEAIEKQSVADTFSESGNSPPSSRTCHPKNCPKSKCSRPYEGFFNQSAKRAVVGCNKTVRTTWSITYEEFLEFIAQRFCHYCGDIVCWPMPHGKTDASGVRRQGYNLDRIDGTKGYTAKNCVVACWPCNETRGTKLSYEEMVLVGNHRRERK